jgi:sec-independent protein translocase protein TatA
MLANILGADAGIVVIIIAIVVFGGNQLPKIAKNVGSAGREFRKAQQEAQAEEEAKAAAASAAGTSVPLQSSATDDRITISKADLDAMLADRPSSPGLARTNQPER